jgi:hypothetical protein
MVRKIKKALLQLKILIQQLIHTAQSTLANDGSE